MGYAKPTAARLIDQRARRRATQALIDLHRDEFRDLYDWHRRNATSEAQVLAVKASEIQHAHPTPHAHTAAPVSTPTTSEPPRLMTGRRKPGQDVTERLDVARCPHCVSHHDRGHVCAKCGAVPETVVAVEDDGEVDEIAVERALGGEPVALTKTEADEVFARMVARGDSDATIAKALGISGKTVLRRRQRLSMESRWTA